MAAVEEGRVIGNVYLGHIVFSLIESVVCISDNMKNTWICQICKKSLSSKQMVVNHIAKLHPESNLQETNYRKVEHKEKDSCNLIGGSKEKKKSAYSSYSNLHNIFSCDDLCERLVLYPKSKSTDVNEDANSLSIVDKQSIVVGFDESQPYASESADVGLIDSSQKGFDPNFSNINNLVQTYQVNVQSSSEMQTLDTLESFSSPPKVSGELSSSRKVFKAPYKLKSHCDCPECTREPCGECYYCLQ